MSIYEDKLQEIISISSKIMKIYNKLYNLEIEGKKHTNIYNKNLLYLNVLIELESEIYPTLSNNDLGLFIDIIKESGINTRLNDFSLIINDNNDSYLYKRIINNLRDENNKRLINTLQKENNVESANSIILNQIIQEDIISAFMFETETSIKNTNNIAYKDSFKMIKYLLSFLNKRIENKLKNNFELPQKLFLTSNLLVDDDNNYKKALKEIYFEYINKEINEYGIDDIYNSSYSYLDYKKILQTNLIKAYLSLDKENILLKRKLYDKIERDNIELEELLSYNNNDIILLKSERLKIYGNSKRL